MFGALQGTKLPTDSGCKRTSCSGPRGRGSLRADCGPPCWAEDSAGARQGSARGQERIAGVRVLVAFENRYSIYGEAIARVIREVRLSIEVTVAETETVAEEVERLLPDLVIFRRARDIDATYKAAWLEFVLEHGRASRICIGGQCSEPQDLKKLLSVVDETQRLFGTERLMGRALYHESPCE